MSENELKQALKFEAQKHIPFSIDEVNLDSFILKEDSPDNKMLVLIAAVKKDFMSQRLKLLEEAGIKVNLVDIDLLALANAFNFNYPQEDNPKYKAVALLNIGSSMSNLDILENGIPRLSRDIHIAGNNFTQKLMEVFSLDFKSAEELKINPDTQRAKSATAAVESVFANLATNIRTSFDYYESQGTTSVGKIFLSGGGSKFTGLKEMLANLMGTEVECWDPFKKIKLPNNMDSQKINALSGQLAVVVGLALR
jgi:type IV pilus assembly protein PilM